MFNRYWYQGVILKVDRKLLYMYKRWDILLILKNQPRLIITTGLNSGPVKMVPESIGVVN
jgi:hypothetical protein